MTAAQNLCYAAWATVGPGNSWYGASLIGTNGFTDNSSNGQYSAWAAQNGYTYWQYRDF